MIGAEDQTMILRSSCGLEIPLRIEVNPRARRLILRLDEKRREAVAVAPSKRYVREAAKFASERIDWAASRLRALPQPQQIGDGQTIPIRGRNCRLTLVGEGRRARLIEGDELVLSLPGDPETIGRRTERFLRKLAKSELSSAVDRYCQTLGVDARRVTVKDTRSRWGSCTSDGRLAFSWRLIMAPENVLEYVAAHECAHLLEMNHSPRFWAHVETCRPDWKRERAWLRKNGSGLHAIQI